MAFATLTSTPSRLFSFAVNHLSAPLPSIFPKKAAAMPNNTENENPHYPGCQSNESPMLHTEKINRAILLAMRAVEIAETGGQGDLAFDYYVEAVGYLIRAFKDTSNLKCKNNLRHQLIESARHLHIEMHPSYPVSEPPPYEGPDIKKEDLGGGQPHQDELSPSTSPMNSLSTAIIEAAVCGAIALKQSPIPNFISSTFHYTFSKMKQLDEAYGVQQKAWEMGKRGIRKAMEVDEQFQLHQRLGQALVTGATAIMKAGIAYQETPSYSAMKARSAPDLRLKSCPRGSVRAAPEMEPVFVNCSCNCGHQVLIHETEHTTPTKTTAKRLVPERFTAPTGLPARLPNRTVQC